MEHPTDVAFCPIFFGRNGGQFDSRGLPIFEKEYDEEGNELIPAKGTCPRPYDCGVCEYMHEWITYQQQAGWRVGWECVYCIKETKKFDEADGVSRALPGFYQAGRVPVPREHEDYDKDNPPIHGCTRCGHECSFLQLVLRR